MSREEAMEMLLQQGMEKEEAERLVGAKAGELVTKGLQIPSDQAARLVGSISKFGAFSGPMRFFVLITKENEQRLLDLLSSTGKESVVAGEFDTADMGKDPIGDYDRKIRDGFAGTAELEGTDLSKMN